VFEDVTRARSETLQASTPGQASQAENHLQGALRSLFAVAEAYPQLQASNNFTQLQRDLVQTEDKIQSSRRYYNGSVRELNTSIKVFPNNLIAGPFGFHDHEFFDVADRAAISEPPRVQF
jgi:LemA protein